MNSFRARHPCPFDCQVRRVDGCLGHGREAAQTVKVDRRWYYAPRSIRNRCPAPSGWLVTSRCPASRQNAGISITASGSVIPTQSRLPAGMPLSRLRALSTGRDSSALEVVDLGLSLGLRHRPRESASA